MLRHLLVGVVLAVCGGAWADFTGTSSCGAQVTVLPMKSDGPLDRKDIKALEKAYGGDLTLAVVGVDNRNGNDAFRFYTGCCHLAVGINGAELIKWVNLREAAEHADLRPSAAGCFMDHDIPKGEQGFFVIGWDHKTLMTINNLSGVALLHESGGTIVECH